MPEPNEFLAIQSLQTALRGITVADGYHFDLAGSAVKIDPNAHIEDLIAPGGPRPFIVIEVLPDRWDLFPASQLRLVLPVTIHWASESDVTDDASWLRTYYRGVADIERALFANTAALAPYAMVPPRITKRSPSPLGGTEVWAMVDIDLKTHRAYGEPDV